MRRFHVPGLPIAGEVWLDGDEGLHLVRVLRAREGDSVALFDGAGREVLARVVRVERARALVAIGEPRDAPAPRRAVTLCTAVPRGKRMEWLVEKCTEAGVSQVVPVAWRRSERADRGANAVRRWRRAAAEAAKQSGRAVVPSVSEPLALTGALAASEGRTPLCAQPGAVATLREVLPAAADESVALYIGPEGGLDDTEAEELAAAGAVRFGLGPLILRIETAAVLAVHGAAH